MHYSRHAAAVLVLVALITPSSAGIIFGPVRAQAGQSIRLVSHSETTGGTLERTIDGQSSKGTIAITRDRELVWTFRAPTEEGVKRGMVRVPRLSAFTRLVIDGKEEKSTDDSPLTGQMFAMSKMLTGEWKFELDGSVPSARVQTDIEELKVYLQRDWFPARELNTGDTWEFDPAWVKMIIEKDLAKAKTIGTMKLQQVRHGEKRQLAVIDVSMHSSGGDFQPDGSESSASIELTGQIIVNLDTMLDESLELKGILNTYSSKGGASSKAQVPIQLSVTKSFVQE